MTCCAITHLDGYSQDLCEAKRRLLERAKAWIVDRVELIQLREKSLGSGELLSLAQDLVSLAAGSATKVLINSRADVAVAAGAHGVHLTAAAGALHPAQVRAVFMAAGQARPMVSVACHTAAEIEQAVAGNADAILYGPVFEKRITSTVIKEGVGLPALRAAVAGAGSVPVLALGGISPRHLPAVLTTGAAGVAGMRMFA